MTCTQHELYIAMLDGCSIKWLAATKEIIGEAGKAKALVCSVMELGVADASGRRAPVDTGQTFTLDVDMVIKAAGQTPFKDLVDQNDLLNTAGKIIVKDNITNLEGVFAGGDCVNGGKEVVDAVQAGKDGAKAILEYLLPRMAQIDTNNILVKPQNLA